MKTDQILSSTESRDPKTTKTGKTDGRTWPVRLARDRENQGAVSCAPIWDWGEDLTRSLLAGAIWNFDEQAAGLEPWTCAGASTRENLRRRQQNCQKKTRRAGETERKYDSWPKNNSGHLAPKTEAAKKMSSSDRI
jgi:hypothetical protein